MSIGIFSCDKFSTFTGIMTEEFSDSLVSNKRSFIKANYVKFLEASGARVVPIL